MGVNRDHVNHEIHVFPLVVCFINVFVCVNVLHQATASSIISYAYLCMSLFVILYINN